MRGAGPAFIAIEPPQAAQINETFRENYALIRQE